MRFTFYKIVDKQNTHCYIGSTRNYGARCCLHKNHYKTKDRLIYNTMKLNGGWDNYKFEIIEEREYETRGEAEKYETELIQRMETQMDILNKNKCGRVPDVEHTWYYKNRNSYLQKANNYYHQNKERILQKMKEVRDRVKNE